MAGSKLKKQIRASTILEVIVAMVVIVVVFGIAMMIYTNVLRTSLSAKKIRAQMILNQLMVQAANHPVIGYNTQVIDGFSIQQEAKPAAMDAGLIDVHLTAFDQNQSKVAELEKLIY